MWLLVMFEEAVGVAGLGWKQPPSAPPFAHTRVEIKAIALVNSVLL